MRKVLLSGGAALLVLIVIGAVAGGGDDEGETASAGPSITAATESSAAADPSPTAAAATAAPATATPAPPPQTPTPTPRLAFEPITLSGVGDAVPEFTIPSGAVAIATLSHNGAANFAVWSIAEDGSEDLLVNAIGAYQGTRLLDPLSEPIAFELTADGAWTIVVSPIREARAWDPSTQGTGRGDDVLRVDPNITGLGRTHLTHNGQANFVVYAHSGSFPDLLVNEIGPYDGDVRIEASTVVLEIIADGDWTLAPAP